LQAGGLAIAGGWAMNVDRAVIQEKSSKKNEYDSPWKKILELHLKDCLAFFSPKAHSEIDLGARL
jgi:hypothetical protein